MENVFMHWVAMFVLLAANLGFISVIIVVPAITIWALYLKLSGKVSERPEALTAMTPRRSAVSDL